MKKKRNQFDQLIREKLEQIQVEYDPTTWDVLAQKLDTQESSSPLVENNLLDEVIFTKLQDATIHHRPTQWERLAERLDAATDARRKVLTYKLMEVALVLLLLLFAGQYVMDSEIHMPKALKSSTSNQLNALSDNNNNNNNSSTEICNENPLAGTFNNTNADNNNKNVLTFKNKQKAITPTTNQLYTTLDSDLPTVEYAVPKYHQVSPTLPGKPLQTQHSSHQTPVPVVDINGTSDYLNLIAPKPWEMLDALEGIMMSELQHNNKIGADYTMLIKPIKKRPVLIVSMFGSGDYNHVITPSKAEGEFLLKEVKRYAAGYSGGITAGLEVGRWEVNTGAIYTSKTYQPRVVLFAKGNFNDGYFVEGIKDIQLNTINVPLHFRYNFIQHDKWRVYATAGLSLQVAFQADYYIGDQAAFKDIFKVNNLPLAPQAKPGYGDDPIDEAKLPKGFLEGGSLWENGYITSNVGLGLERYMTGRWSIFAQPTYHYSLDYFTHGLGPDKDRIHTMSFFTGVRVRLNQ